MDTKENFEPTRDKDQPMFWVIKGKKGGNIPTSLQGKYTKKYMADQAIANYIQHEKYDTVKKPYSSKKLQEARAKKCPEATAKSTRTKQQSGE